MTQLSPLPSAGGASPTRSASAATGTGGGAAADGTRTASFTGGDFETFLRMLTTQIKNQDPLNPMEGSDFAVQLATFTGVEQQVRTNQLLETMASTQGTGLGALAGWIGREVRTTAPVAFDGATPITMDVAPTREADKAVLVTLDASGAEVLREDIGLGTGEIDWLGRNGAGDVLPRGRYSFRLDSIKDGKVIDTADVGVFAPVTGAELTAEGVRLTLAGGAWALESQVSAIRAPG